MIRQCVAEAANYHGVLVALLEDVHPKTSHAFTGDGQVTFGVMFERGDLVLAHDAIGDHSDFSR